jgi:polar amino acid transport system substrate-binding protein
MFKNRALVLWTALILPLLAGPADAAPVRLVTGTDYAPFADAALPSGGLAGALVQAAFAAVDVPVEPLQFEPWKRGYADVLAGVDDATFPYVRSPEREADMLYSDPIYDIVAVALFRAGSGRDYVGPDSLKGLNLCMPIGYAASPPIARLIASKAVSVEQPATADLCLKQLAEGRVDVFVAAADLLDRRIAALFGQAPVFFRAPTPVYSHSLYLIAPRTAPGATALIQHFDEGLAQIRADGRYDAIVQRQLGAS